MAKAAIEGDEYRPSALGGIITDLRLILCLEFSSWNVCVCPRVCNKTASANALAAFGSLGAEGLVVPRSWDAVPQFIEALLISDSS